MLYPSHLLIIPSDGLPNAVLDPKIWKSKSTVEMFYWESYYDTIPYFYILGELKNEKALGFFFHFFNNITVGKKTVKQWKKYCPAPK